MFSTLPLIAVATSAMASIASSVKVMVSSSVPFSRPTR
jgi:hypothetical protein